MIIIRELAPSMFVVQCPIRGTFHKTAANRQQARQLVWEAGLKGRVPPGGAVFDNTKTGERERKPRQTEKVIGIDGQLIEED